MPRRARSDLDVVVAGGGGSGCLAAWRLARQGVRVALVERGGPPLGSSSSPSELRRPSAIRLLRQSDPGWSYRTSAEDAAHSYTWLRATGLGGRLNYWLGTSLRFERDDFVNSRTPALRWPIDDHDVAPYYDEIEDELGCAHDAGAGFPHDQVDEWVAVAARACGTRAVPARQATARPGRGPGGAFCSISPLDRWIPEAQATGRCFVLPSTVVRRVMTDRDGRSCGVEVVMRGGASVATLEAPIVVLATSTVETARVLLDSATAAHPDGLGNQSGLVGKHLTDHVVMWAKALVRVPVDAWGQGDPGNRPVQTCYIPAWPTPEPDAPPPSRFHVQVMVRDVTALAPRGVGPAERIVALTLSGVGEALALPGNEVVLDPSGRRDANGSRIPLLRFDWDESHHRLAGRIPAALLDLIGALPCDVLAVDADDHPALGGYGHEVGTARMGTAPSASVASPTCEVHGVGNLFLVDGSPFVSYPDKNPTLTILANCARVCDEVVDRV